MRKTRRNGVISTDGLSRGSPRIVSRGLANPQFQSREIMGAANANGLTPEELLRLDTWLREFELKWEEGALARCARELPPAGPLRQLALAGLVKIDLRRHWQQGRKRSLEEYLRAHPELGTADTVAVDLIQAEMQARKQA